jgi:hypothetical protein
VQPKELHEALSMLSMNAKKDDVSVKKPEEVEEPAVLSQDDEEEEVEEGTPAPLAVPQPQEEPQQQQGLVEVARDSVDDFLRMTSWGVLFVVCALLYRKLLVLYAPEM